MRERPSRPATMLVGSVIVAAIASSGGVAFAQAGALPASSTTPASASRSVAAAQPASGRDIGRWRVTESNPGQYLLTWTSPSPLPVTDARPQIVGPATGLGATTVSADGRNVSTVVQSKTRPSPGDFDVWLSGRVLDQTPQVSSAPEVPYVSPREVERLGTDPGELGTHDIQSRDYTLRPQKLPDISLLAEMVGHVVEPTDATDRSPLVLFLHGRHSACYLPSASRGEAPAAALSKATAQAAVRAWKCPGKLIPIPSYLGYDYAQRLLAGRGYVTVSISADAINDLDYSAVDGGATARAALIEHHLDAWRRMVARGREHADLGNVVLVGHSRGGEGVNRASVDISRSAPYTVTGQVLIGPTDFGFQSAPFVPTVTMLPYCDGDVSDLQGQNFTDDGRDLTDRPQALHSSILVMGANHNFFNSEWTPGISAAPSNDDWYGPAKKTCGTQTDTRLTPLGQRKVGKSYIAAAVALFARDNRRVLPLFDGTAVSLPSADNADVRSHVIGGGLDLRRPRLDSRLSTPVGATTRFCLGLSDARQPKYCEPKVSSSRAPHWPSSYFDGVPLRPEFEMRWTAAGQVGGFELEEPWNLSDDRTLDLRTIVAPPHPANLQVMLKDSQGHRVVLDHVGSRLNPLPGGGSSLSKRWAQTLRVSLARPAAVDLTDVVEVNLVSVNPTGHVWVVDMSARPVAGVKPLPTRFLATINLGKVRQPEGDAQGTSTVHIPYTITGNLKQDATVRLVTGAALATGTSNPRQVTIPAHTTQGSFALMYPSNNIDDPARERMWLTAYALHGIQTDRYIGQATILDDDPAPKVTLRVRSRHIVEGSRARWNLTLSAPVSYYGEVRAAPVRVASGRQLTVGDLPKRFRHQHFSAVPPLDTPLFKTDLYLFGDLPPGSTKTHVSLPTMLDTRAEPARSMTLRFRVYRIPLDRKTATVEVADPQ